MGTLYVVATPIGNLGDMSARAIETLRNVAVIAAEDTRHSGRLLQHFGIETPMLSYHQHNRAQREELLLERLALGDVALISDAGTPAIADPGTELVAVARSAGHRVVPVPGASALVAAVSASGLVEGPFHYLGFLPRVAQERRLALGRAARAEVPLVVFESPLRLHATLTELHTLLGDRPAMVARELTKLHEEFIAGSLANLRDQYANDPPRGEIVLVVGAPPEAAPSSEEESAEAVVSGLLADGLRPSRAAREASAILGITGAAAYDLVRRITAARPEPTS